MSKYDEKTIKKVQHLRHKGKTYSEIIKIIKFKVPKSTLSEWCKNTKLPPNYQNKINKMNITSLGKARATALAIRFIKKEELLKSLNKTNLPISKKITNINISKIALAMLCLGEASKSIHKHTFSLGSSDYKIITLFINLLKRCFNIKQEKIRCTVQCRADQNQDYLKLYWSQITKLPLSQFYKTLIDPRTVGKPTKNKEYKGVLNVYYWDYKIQLELESLAELIYNQIR